MVNKHYVSLFVLVLALANSTTALGQGEGPIPNDLRDREKIDWILREVGTTDDETTIRESIEGTDNLLLEVIRSMASDEDLAELRRQIENKKELSNEDIEKIISDTHVSFNIFALTVGVLVAVLIAMGGVLFRLSVRLEARKK